MKSSLYAIAIAVLLAATCMGTHPRAAGQQQGNGESKPCATDQAAVNCPSRAAAGIAKNAPAQAPQISFHILAEFSEGLNVKKLKPGDKIKAQVSQDVLWHGRIIIPEDSKLEGHVTEVKRRATDDPESRLGLVFDRVLLKHHQEVDFKGVLQALSPPAPRRSRVDEPDQMLPPATLTMSSSSAAPMGGTPSRGAASTGSINTMSVSAIPAGVPTYTGSNPGDNPGNAVGGEAARSEALKREESKPMSAGMPRGVFGIKGLALSSGPSATTPGPVIVSTVNDVKLEYGTQVLLNISDPIVRKQ